MTLTEVTTDFTSGTALGSCLSPGVRGSELRCLLGNPGVLSPSRRGWPSARPAPRLHLLLDRLHCPAEPRGEKPSEAAKGLALFWVVLLLTIVPRSIAVPLTCVGADDLSGMLSVVGGRWVGLASTFS